MNGLILIFVIYFLIYSSCVVFADLIVTLPNGQIRGHMLKTDENKTFYGFQGIPFAAPPVGSLRFQAPVPPENWDGILDATKNGPDCTSRIPFNDYGRSEDCLYINVYTPKLNTNTSNESLLAVIFYIYGGRFNSGTSIYSMYGPDYLIQEDVVFVSFNFRSGPYGFLSTEDTVIPGNAGLKDQNLALKWTHQNIHLFGGDPEKITIVGESTGAASIAYHLLSEKSAGLFRAAIAQSGTALGTWALNRNPKHYVLKLVNKLAENGNFTIDTSTLTSVKLLEILRDQTAESITAADSQITIIHEDKDFVTVPCLEIPHTGAFITESSVELLSHGNFNRVPTIMGLTSEEYLFFMSGIDDLAATAKGYDENLERLIPLDLVLDSTTNKTEVAEAIKGIYLNRNQSFADNLGAAARYGSDNLMTRSIIKHAKLQYKYSSVYFYQFSYHGKMSMLQNYPAIDGTMGTVGHAEDFGYLFKMIFTLNNHTINTTDLSVFSSQDILTHKRFIKLWTNFVKYLNPTPEKCDLLQNITWPTLKHLNFQYLNIGENLELREGYPRGNSFPLWHRVYNKYGVKPFYNF